jgi:predicted RND superfamily exporter protein
MIETNMEECEGVVSITSLLSIIDENEYVKSCVSNKKKDTNSLSYLVDRPLSQSDCIKLGTGMEKVLMDIIIKNNSHIKNIKSKNIKGKKEKDHLFKNENEKTIYYAEIKSNLNLDTEKCKSTSEKCQQLFEELQIEYPDYKIKMYLVGTRYINKDIIPKIIKNKYLSIQENVVGIDEYLNEMNTTIMFNNEENYKIFLNYLANSMFD